MYATIYGTVCQEPFLIGKFCKIGLLKRKRKYILGINTVFVSKAGKNAALYHKSIAIYKKGITKTIVILSK